MLRPERASQEEQLATLKQVDEASEKLQKIGQYLKALQCMEEGVMLRRHIYGVKSPEVHHACKSVASMCNYIAMERLQNDQLELALELLRKAEVLTKHHPSVRAVTFNNMGCFFRKQGKFRTALRYVSKALELEARLGTTVKSADTHLNMCTILSELKRHDKALVHARDALKLMLLELFGPTGFVSQQQQQLSNQAAQNPGQIKLPPDRVAVLAIAYHNMAVQHEFLGKHRESLSCYEKACHLVNTHLQKGHPLVQQLASSKQQARRTVEKMKARSQERRSQGKRKPRGKPWRGTRGGARGKGKGSRHGSAAPLSSRDLQKVQKSISNKLAVAVETSPADEKAPAEDAVDDLNISDSSLVLPTPKQDASFFLSDDEDQEGKAGTTAGKQSEQAVPPPSAQEQAAAANTTASATTEAPLGEKDAKTQESAPAAEEAKENGSKQA